ncbi:MAG: NAD(P)H-binding protein [Terriglobia bacterium]|nr:NAD(P)H-binding protein [Terriglobia bacterium]
MSVVTGGFGFSGRCIAQKLLMRGERVRTLTNHPDTASALYDRMEIARLDFEDEATLARSLAGATVLFNTYWVRFAYGGASHELAIRNTKRLIRAAEAAGVKKIVHVSITNPSLESPLPYFRGKAEVEESIRASKLSYAILRPAVLFGQGDILINNIAWMLRNFPVFAVPRMGEYRVQPIFVEDLAELAVASGRAKENGVSDAVGPETYTYDALVRMIQEAIGSRARITYQPAPLIRLASKILGLIVDDVVLTRDEIKGLTADLLVSHGPPTGHTSLHDWIYANARNLGTTYASELGRHYREHAAGHRL